MKVLALNLRNIEYMLDDKLVLAYQRLQKLLEIAEQKPLSESSIQKINAKIEELNTSNKINGALLSLVQLTESEIIEIIEQDSKMVPKGHYSKRWIAIGMSAIGVPLGLIVGMLMDNIALLAVGIPVGLGIGSLIGKSLDSKAAEEGRQYSL